MGITQLAARNPRFDVSDPSVPHLLGKFFKKLERRTYEKLEVFHYLETASGWHCLDLNLCGLSRKDLDCIVIKEMARSRQFTEICTPSDRSLWMRMAYSPVLREDVLVCPGSPRKRYLVASCSEVRSVRHH